MPLDNSLFIFSGIIYYFYFKYGEIRPFTWDDYLVLEYVEGKPLSSPLPEQEAVMLAIQIATALDVAHKKGIIHRDLKPANIMVTDEGAAVDPAFCQACGMCQAVCPLFAETGREADVARGKLALLDGLMQQMFEDPEGVSQRLNKCLLCGSCAANCPSGVNVLEIFIKARAIATRCCSPPDISPGR